MRAWRQCIPIRNVVFFIGATFVLNACSTDEKDNAFAGSGGSTPASNAAPTVKGIPPTSVEVGASYDFTPVANDIDGDALTFAASGMPRWASFEASTGRLFGTPDTNDMGIHGEIVITAFDGTDSGSLGPFSIDVIAAGSGDDWVTGCTEIDGPASKNFAGAFIVDYVTPTNGEERYVWSANADVQNQAGLTLRRVGQETEVRLFRKTLTYGLVDITGRVPMQDGVAYTIGFRMGEDSGMALSFNGARLAANTTAVAKAGASANAVWYEGSEDGVNGQLDMPLVRLRFFDEGCDLCN